MRVLGIETSCDDTGIGIVSLKRDKITVEVNTTASQVLIHRKYGGVVPEIAAREHAVTILPTLQAAMKQGRVTWKDIDAIAVTGGPGLNTALLVGVETARTLSYIFHKPLVRVNHIEGHIVSNWASPEAAKIIFPAVALIVSGGHTELILMKRFGHYSLLGRTLDDAVGEAFDKTAKILGLPYPGGPALARRAAKGDASRFTFPAGIINRGLDFSYSGLKTSVLYMLQKQSRRKTSALVNDISASFQRAAIVPLVKKSVRAVGQTNAKTFLLGGGVAANAVLRRELRGELTKTFPNLIQVQPVLPLCMDNGAMIGIAGAFRARVKDFTPWQKITADPNWELV